MAPVVTKTPSGEEIVILSRPEYDALIEAREDAEDGAVARAVVARVAAGTEEMLTTDEVNALLAAATPLAFWRKKRGLTQAALAAEAGVAQGYISELEAGRKTGDVMVLRRIANALRITLEDLVPDETR
jgi:DNA-binding XRE family transcriptional regulator